MLSADRGLVARLLSNPGRTGAGNRLNSLTAFESRRLEGMRLPANESLTKPLPVAFSPVTGSTCPFATGRVVLGSKTVPQGTVRPRRSGPRVQLCPAIRSVKFVKPLARSDAVGTGTK